MVLGGSLWKKFQNLQGQSPKKIATVISKDGDEFTVEFKSNGRAVVRSPVIYQVGKSVFVQGGEIIGEAPSLEFAEFEV